MIYKPGKNQTSWWILEVGHLGGFWRRNIRALYIDPFYFNVTGAVPFVSEEYGLLFDCGKIIDL